MAENLWPNADLESGIDDWNGLDGGVPTHSTTEYWEQDYSVRVDPGAGLWAGANSDNKAIIDPSTQYTVSAYIFPTISADYRIVVITDVGGNLNAVSESLTLNTWTRLVATFTTDGSDSTVRIEVKKSNHAAEDEYYVDAVMLETGGSASTWENYSEGSAIPLTAAIAAVTDTGGGHSD